MKISRRSSNTPNTGIFYRQVAALVAAGVPMNEALFAVVEENAGASTLALDYLGEDVEEKDLFKKVLRYLEENSRPNKNIAEALYRVADEIDKYREFKLAISQIFYIPVMTLVISGFLLSIMLTFVIPVWQELFSTMSGHLPRPTQYLLEISRIAWDNIHYVALLIIIVAVLLLLKRKAIITIFSRLPMARSLILHQSMVRFTRYLSVLLHIDMPLGKAAVMAAGEIRNPVYTEKFKQAASRVTGKFKLSSSLKESGLISPIVGRIIDTGEKSGTLPQSLNDISVLYEKEADIALAKTVYWFDIAIKFMVGIIVGFVIVAMYLPIFKMAGAVG